MDETAGFGSKHGCKEKRQQMNLLIGLLGSIGGILLALILFDRLAPIATGRAGLRLERRRSGLSESHAQIPGFRIPYLQGGPSDGEVLLLIHGFGGDKDNFTRMARFLTPHYRVICPDLPGFGDASRDLSADYRMADQVERMRVLLDQLGIKKIHLGGNSMGGFIAAQFCASYPERVASLWLLDAAGTAASHDSAVLHHYLLTGEMPLLLRTEQDFAALMQATTHRPPFLPYSVRTLLARRAIADYALHSRIMPQLVESPLLETQYRSLPTPCLITWGAEDLILNPAGTESFRVLFPNSQVDMMPGVGHVPMLEAPKQSAMRYLSFRHDLGVA
jgi:pimeloyl-ACP methyl ester carboxylesterase